MIDPKAITTYAQYNEDVILLALLHDVKKGFYVDVGANYPTTDSVTKLFYERGWRGVNIEPVKSLYQDFKNERPQDINLQIGAGAKTGSAILREYINSPGHSTFDKTQKETKEQTLEYEDYEVEVKPLAAILEDKKVKHIHFLKIDVEGFEHQVVAGNDWAKFRPEVVCIEANHIQKDWKTTLLKNQYKLFIQDGLNEYYVAEESWDRTDDFAERVIKLDYFALKQHQAQSWAEDIKQLDRLTKITEDQHNLIKILEHQSSHSLKDQPMMERLKRSASGLTIDWLKYKKDNRPKKT